MPKPVPPPVPTPSIPAPVPMPPPLVPRQFAPSDLGMMPSPGNKDAQPLKYSPGGDLPPLPPLSRSFDQAPMPARLPRRHSWKWLGVLAIIIVLLAGGAYAAYAFVFEPSIAIPSAVAGVDSAAKLHGELTLSLDAPGSSLDGSTLSLAVDTDRTVPLPYDSRVTIDAESSSGGVGGEIRLVNGVLYGEVTSLPPSFSNQMSQYTNHWYSVSLQTLWSAAASYGVATSSYASARTPSSIADAYARLQAAGVLTQPTFAGVTFADGKPVRTYTFTVNKDALLKLLTSASELASTGSSTNDYLQSWAPIAESALAGTTFSPITISVDLFSGSLREISGSVTATSPTSQEAGQTMTLHADLKYDDTQTDMTISAPAGAQSMDSYITSGVTQSKANSANISAQVTLNSIAEAMRSHYSQTSSYSGECNTDATVKSSLASLTAAPASPICRDSAKSFVVAVLLSATSTTAKPVYFCTDSTRSVITLPKAPVGTVCK